MKKLLTILFLLGSLILTAQNPNLVTGVQKQYTIAGRTVLVWTPTDTTSFKKYNFVMSFTGNSCNDSAAAVNQGFAKRIRTNTTGIHRDSFVVVTFIRQVSENSGIGSGSAIDNVIDTIIKYNKFIDTSRCHMTGLSQGAQEVIWYLSSTYQNILSYTPKHQSWFKTQVYNSPGSYTESFFNDYHTTNTWISWGTDDAVTGTVYPALMYTLFGTTYVYAPPKTKKIEITGAGHDATVWDSTTSLAGTTYNDNVWKWMLQATYGFPGGGGGGGTPYPAATNSPKITISKNKIFDLNGVTKKSGWGLFDGDTLTRMDLDGIGMNFYLRPFRSFIVLDSNYKKFQVRYFDGGGSGTTLTLKLYDSTKTLVGTKALTTESYLTWKRNNDIDTTLSVRFVEIFANTIDDFNSGIFELQLFGVAGTKGASIYPGTPIVPIPDLNKDAHGINILDDKLGEWLRGTNPSVRIVDSIAGSLRVYYESPRFDYIPDGYDGNLADQPLWLGRFGFDHIKTRVVDQVTAGRFKASLTWLASQGSIKHLNNTDGHDTLKNYVYLGAQPDNKYLTTLGADSLNPASWRAAARLIYKLAAFYGSNALADTTGIVVKGGTKVRGQNGFRVFEIGNELTFNDTVRYHSPAVYYTMMKAIYDSAKIADPNLKIYLGATTYMHNAYWRALYFYHFWNYGASTPVPFDGICMNLYLSNEYDGQGASPSSYALSPERWGLFTRTNELKQDFDLMFPNKPVRLTEGGYATNVSSSFNTVGIGGRDSADIATDWTLRFKAIIQIPRLVEEYDYYSYWEAGGYVFNSMAATRAYYDGGGGAYNGSSLFKQGYGLANEFSIEKNYNWFVSNLIANGDSTGNWVTKKDHVSDPNKKLFKVWRGTEDGTTTSNYILNVGANVVDVKLYSTNYSAIRPNVSALTPSGTNVTIPTVSGAMQWVEVTYSSAPIENPQQVRIKKFQRVIAN